MKYKTKLEYEQIKKHMENNKHLGIRNSEYRDLFLAVIQNKPVIDDIVVLRDSEGHFGGNISFSFALRDIGLSESNIYLNKQELSSKFFLSFLGELLVRENINEFMEKLSGVDIEEYLGTSNRRHEKFGMRKIEGKLTLTFHISLLKDLIAEEFQFQLNK